uniref:Uncharacterized protein n=1 Tax=Hyaloperonospora arabidopsidis (strain Emoy2) TaxID=559515 RepID=M4BSZ6_HYAAE
MDARCIIGRTFVRVATLNKSFIKLSQAGERVSAFRTFGSVVADTIYGMTACTDTVASSSAEAWQGGRSTNPTSRSVCQST